MCGRMRTLSQAIVVVVLLLNLAVYKLLSLCDACRAASDVITQRLHIKHTRADTVTFDIEPSLRFKSSQMQITR